ncbi:MAG: glycosyltransferase, partial [Bacteroidota bacterium]
MKKNILYICTPTSIHDQKWMRFFAEKEDFKIFAVGESKMDESTFNDLKKQNINLLPSIDSFSIKTPFENYQSIQKLRKYCELYKIDLVHILFATPYALWVNYLNKPYIITTRGSDVLVVLPELKKQKGIKGIYYSWLFNKFQKAFSGALT